MLKASTQLCVSPGDGPPGEMKGQFLEEVTLAFGSQRMRRSFSGEEEKGHPGRMYFQRHGG